MPTGIQIEGLKEFRVALRELGDIEATGEFKQAGRKAAEVVQSGARSRAAGLGPMFVKAAQSIRPATTVTGGAVRFGRGFAGAFGAEFGAAQNQRRIDVGRGPGPGYNQFRAWRGSGGSAGYFLWPTIREDNDQIVAVFERETDHLIDRVL